MVGVCPNLLTTGACTESTCDYNHDVHVCVPCGVVSASERAKNTHLNGARHRRCVQHEVQSLRCPICEAVIPGLGNWKQHIYGKRHRSLAATKGVSPNVDPEEGGGEVAGQVYCTVCDVYVHEDAWPRHPQARLHVMRLRFGAMRSSLEEAAKDKHGVTVSPADVDFGVLDSSRIKKTVEVSLEVQTTVPLSTVELLEAKLAPKSFGRVSHFSVSSGISPAKLVCGRRVRITISFSSEHLGMYDDRLELIFQDTKLRQKFVIARSIRAVVGGPEYMELQPKAPFVPRKRASRDREVEVVPGDPPPALGAVRYVVPLPHAHIPEYMSRILSSSGSLAATVTQFRASLLPSSLRDITYGRHFKALLWAEEFRSEQDLQIYDISSTRLNRHNSYYYLEVPGLAEKRPSVLVGDSILVQPLGIGATSGGKWFEGCVHVVRKEEVGMRFGHGFPGYTPTQLYRVRFRLNRHPLRRQHQALDTAFAPSRLLFPAAADVLNNGSRLLLGAGPLVYNKSVETNPAQLQAVTSIVNLPIGSPPFVVFGPPGTGKTITVVEAMRQVLARDPNARILACAPSNSAADILAERLTILGKDALFRFYAPSRFKDQVPLALQDFTRTTPDGHFTIPPVTILKCFKVVVTTCVSASVAHNIGMPRGHFTHIFVDEAGQATEPEVMIGIKTMADNNTNVVLAGDPKQLGPIIRSAIARELGLEKSYLERMMESPAHNGQHWDGYTYVQLTQNFRSHLRILEFPNGRFYNNSLRPFGDRKVIESYIGHPILPNPKFPIIFHALSGEDAREASSPSFFNPLQVIQVKKYIEQLRADRRVRIADKDIGVITPYHAQCLKIRAALRPVADQVKVGSVEEFQGQERRVIIISTVRSSREWVEYDLKHTLGFLANPRRLNVAVTRAQALLIVIGDATVLALDPLWRSFLNYIHLGGGWKGDPPTWDTREAVRESGGYDTEAREAGEADMNNLMRRMESLTMRGLAGDGSDDEQEDNADRPWREVE